MGPAASVLYGAGSRGRQVPVYDARRVLAGAAIVEVLACSIKVAPARQSIRWMNLWAAGHGRHASADALLHAALPLSSGARLWGCATATDKDRKPVIMGPHTPPGLSECWDAFKSEGFFPY